LNKSVKQFRTLYVPRLSFIKFTAYSGNLLKIVILADYMPFEMM